MMKPCSMRNGGRDIYPLQKAENLRRLFVGSSVKYNTKTAFIKREKGGWAEVGYSSFMDSVDALGTALYRRGFSGATVALAGANSFEWACVFAAVAGGLGTVLPLPASSDPAKTVSAALACGARAVFCDAGLFEDIGRAAADSRLEVFSFDDLPSLISEGRILLFENETGFVSLDPLPGSAAVYSLCGPGKASVFTHEAVCAAIAGIGRAVSAGQSDRVMNIHPWSGLYSLYFGLLFPVSSGASVVIGRTLATLASDMRETSPTFLCAVPGLCNRLYGRIIDNLREKTGGSEERFRAVMRLSETGPAVTRHFFSTVHDALGGRLRIIFCGPRPGDETALRGLRSLGFRPVQVYGPSGTLPPVAMTTDAIIKDGAVGYAAPGSVIDIFDPKRDGVGRIRFKGPGCPSGFIEAGKGLSAAQADGWYYTGDLGSLDADGCLRVYGPESGAFAAGAEGYVFPAKIEKKLEASSAVAGVRVVPLPSKEGVPTRPAAVVMPDAEEIAEKSGEQPSRALMISAVADAIGDVNMTLPDWKKIARVAVVSADEFAGTDGKSPAEIAELFFGGRTAGQSFQESEADN